MLSTAVSPTDICITPSSQPLIIWPTPIVNWNGVPRSFEESNLALWRQIETCQPQKLC
jgi:hypothetical protein